MGSHSALGDPGLVAARSGMGASRAHASSQRGPEGEHTAQDSRSRPWRVSTLGGRHLEHSLPWKKAGGNESRASRFPAASGSTRSTLEHVRPEAKLHLRLVRGASKSGRWFPSRSFESRTAIFMEASERHSGYIPEFSMEEVSYKHRAVAIRAV